MSDLVPSSFLFLRRNKLLLVVGDVSLKGVDNLDVNAIVCTVTMQTFFYKKIEVSWKGDKLCDMHMTWDYEQRTCKISMPDCVKTAASFSAHYYKKNLN